MTIEELEAEAHNMAISYVSPYGFTMEESCTFVKKHSFGFDRLTFTLTTYRSDAFGIRYLQVRRYNQIESLLEKYANVYRLFNSTNSMTFGIHAMHIDKKYDKYPNDAILKEGFEMIREGYEVENLRAFFEDFKWQYENLLMPILEKSRDVRWLDEKINSEPIKFKDFGEIIPIAYSTEFHKLIIAKLAGNPNYDQIYQLIRCTLIEWAAEEEYGKRMLSAFDKVYEDLKEVKPLENPILA